MPGTTLQMHAGNEKGWVWTTVDFVDETPKIEAFAAHFSSAESDPLLPNLDPCLSDQPK